MSACDNHAQHALLLMEIPLADAALRSGALDALNQRTTSIEARAKQALSCTPRDSLVWLVLFGKAVQRYTAETKQKGRDAGKSGLPYLLTLMPISGKSEIGGAL